MGDYRSAYEKYYKNINNQAKGRSIGREYGVLGRDRDGKYNINNRIINGQTINFWVSKIIKQLIVATVLLIIIFSAKIIPFKQGKEIYSISKQTLEQKFDFNHPTEYINDLNIAGVNIENFNINDLKSKALQYVEYLKNNSNLQLNK